MPGYEGIRAGVRGVRAGVRGVRERERYALYLLSWQDSGYSTVVVVGAAGMVAVATGLGMGALMPTRI